MTTQTNTSNGAYFKNFQAADIKTLIQHQGKLTQAGGTQIVLKNPSSTDPVLLSIIKDPKFTAKVVGAPSSEGLATFEVSGNGKTAKIQVAGKGSY
jgi:hypothetical protein